MMQKDTVSGFAPETKTIRRHTDRRSAYHRIKRQPTYNHSLDEGHDYDFLLEGYVDEDSLSKSIQLRKSGKFQCIMCLFRPGCYRRQIIHGL